MGIALMMGTTAAALMWWFHIKGRQRGEALMYRRFSIAYEADLLLRSNPKIVIAPQVDRNAGTRDPDIIRYWISNDVPITWRVI